MEIFNKQIQLKISDIGAEITNLKYFGEELIWQNQKGYWPSQAPILFPFCGFLKDGFYLHDGQRYESPVHGFSSTQKFNVLEKTDSKIIFSLRENSETLRQYPFNFELSISYEIVDSEVIVEFTVKNTSTDLELPYSIGWHPGFKVSKNSFIQFNKKSFHKKEVSDQGLIGKTFNYKLENGKLLLNKATFSKGGIVLEKPNSNILLKTAEYEIHFHYESFPNLVLWGQPGADFVCVEPWFGMGDSINHNNIFLDKKDLIPLKPGQEKRHKLSLNLKMSNKL